MENKILIRADGNAEIGLGHLIRCIALAHMLQQEFKVSFYFKAAPPSLLGGIKESGFGLNKINSESDFLSVLTGKEIVVLDHYDLLDPDYQQKIKNTGCKLVCIDDLHNTAHFADLIINHSPGVSPKDYQAQAYTDFALGPEFSLLRPSFIKAAAKKRKIENVESALICFGGSDIKNITKKVLEAVIDIEQIKKINVVVGAANPHRESIIKICEKKDSRINIFESLDEHQMLSVIQSSDLAIVPASGILLESLAGGSLPLICYYAENQKELFNYFYENKMLPFFDALDLEPSELKIKIRNILKLSNSSKITLLRKKIENSPSNNLSNFRKLVRT